MSQADTVVASVRISRDLYAWAKKRAERDDRTVSSLVRIALKRLRDSEANNGPR